MGPLELCKPRRVARTNHCPMVTGQKGQIEMATPDTTQEARPNAKDFWQGFPEAPFSDTFKWIDAEGYEHMLTIRGWEGGAMLKAVEKAKEFISGLGGKPVGKFSPAPTASSEPVMVPMTDENGTAIVGLDHQPIMEKVENAKVYTIEGVAHDKTSNGKDVLKVFTVEQESFISRKYGVNCFHAPAQYKDFKNWPTGAKYAPKDGATHVVIKAPEGDSKYANIVDFRP